MSAIQSVYAAERLRVAREHANALPVAVECSTGRLVFLAVPRNATVADLEGTVRAALNDKKLSLTVEGCAPAPSAALRDIHDACKRADGFLYVAVSGAKTMGASANCCYATDQPYDLDE